jgi:hypothetical protein
MSDEAAAAGWEAVADLYHAYLTGLILSAVTRRGEAAAADLVFATFRRQHLEKFLPGLAKLGLTHLPHAVACAQYHYLSNQLGGVKVEYMYESDRKAWVRYVPPRWIFENTAICAVPSAVSRAMLRGWHAHNGVTLGNPRLGFVCTKQTTDGQAGLEGYYLEYDRDLAPEERLRFSPGEDGPDFDPTAAPAVDAATWPRDRRQKAYRNYAMEYVRTILPAAMARLGPADGGALGRLTGRLIGMQYHDRIARRLGVEGRGTLAFADLFGQLARAQGDDAEVRPDGDAAIVTQRTWRLMRGVGPQPPEVFDAWNGLWEGALAVHDRRLRLEVVGRMDLGDRAYTWRIARRGPSAAF